MQRSIDFEELHGFAGIYQRQQFLLDIQKKIVSDVYKLEGYNPAMMKGTFYHIQHLNDDYMTFARSLIFNYEYYLNE